MVRLDCNAKNCIHNADNCCCRGNILVDGSQADEKSSTNCSSFFVRTEDGAKNRLETPDTYIGVDCYAENCRYNRNMVCHADHINIAGSSAFTIAETQCSTFEAK
jgi:hypothetical protein